MDKITESTSLHNDLEKMSTSEILLGINNEDHKVAHAVEKCIPAIQGLVDHITENMKAGGRLRG